MNLQEMRFFSIYLSKINPQDVSTRVVRFPLEDFKRIMEFQSLNLTQLRESFVRFLQQVVSVPNEDRPGFSSFQLFKKCKLFQDELDQWYVEIDVHDDALPLMFEFKDRYFTYQLWNALHLKSANQIRLYEILKQYEKIGKREIPVADLREMLGLEPDEYPRWDNFKTKVIDSCQQAIAENTDITFTYEKGKSGRNGKWMTIIFHIHKNEKYVDPLRLSDFIAQKKNVEAMAGTDIIAQLGVICENAFPYEKMQRAYRMAKTFVSDKAIKTYFEQTYLKLLEMEEMEPVDDRFFLFFRILCTDADRQRRKEQEEDDSDDYLTAYEIVEYEFPPVPDEEDDDE